MENLVGGCTWRFALTKDEATGNFTIKTDVADAQRAQHGKCPLCGAELVARKGEQRTDHWSHLSGRKCDDWYEPKGEWHRCWQGRFPREWQEVSIVRPAPNEERHIADVRTGDGWVIECQYSHLSTQEILIRENFYGDMVWLVSGTRLVYDKPRFEPHTGKEFSRTGGTLPYVTIPQGGASKEGPYFNRFWLNRGKIVFFDFEGRFNEPCLTNDLYCLLPEVVNSRRIVIRVTQDEFVTSFREDSEGFVRRLKNCAEHYAECCRKEAEAKIAAKRKVDEYMKIVRERERQKDIANPARIAMTCGWVEGWLYVNKHIDSAYGDINFDSIPEFGRMAIHLRNEYSTEEYKKDRATAIGMLGGNDRIVRDFPQYTHLRKYRGSVVAIFDYGIARSGGETKLVFERGGRLPNMNGGVRVVHDIPDGKGVWTLSPEQIVAVNDRAFREPKREQAKPEEKTPSAKPQVPVPMVYTGKGNLYRDSKTGWLHILKNGCFIPLRKENQNWDKTFDYKFGKRGCLW